MRLPFACLAFATAIGLAFTTRIHSNPPEKLAEPAKPCGSSTTTLASGQKICFEYSPPTIVLQARQADAVQRCCHFLQRPWFGGGHAHAHGVPVQTVPFTFAPTQAVPVQTLNFAPAQALTFAPAQALSFAPAQAMSFAPAQAVNFAPAQAFPFGYGQAAPAQIVPIFMNGTGAGQFVPPATGSGQAVGQPGGGAGADRKELNDTLKELNKNLDGLMKIVERHTEYIIDHNTRLKKVEDFLLNEVNSKLPKLEEGNKFKR